MTKEEFRKGFEKLKRASYPKPLYLVWHTEEQLRIWKEMFPGANFIKAENPL